MTDRHTSPGSLRTPALVAADAPRSPLRSLPPILMPDHSAMAVPGQAVSMTDELSDDDLDRIEARAEASLPSPWEAFVEGRDHLSGDDFIRTGGLDDSAPDMYVVLSYWNNERPKPAGAAVLDFIAAARQDVPRLVAEIRRLRARPFEADLP